ncbi:hypothetical protein GCM10009530_63380 [Microbispora corallina]|uniref:Uncharacterized protein n=1 Tax=Microbispora corallina TaxID=83302 RepID=A0ABQ4GBL9_9ACTN|nr:hypothetical protein [Microbispora corallina]GIH44432.1 hypothetical protein Mco01_74320 [Microbispora corallina]
MPALIRQLLLSLTRPMPALHHELKKARAEAAELTERLAARTKELGQAHTENEQLRQHLATAYEVLAQHDRGTELAGATVYIDRAIQTPPPPINYREEALRERERANALEERLAIAEGRARR